ncbi:hypothetical protein DITRI_Ditri18aG0028800 [Diplodiscus trichospermus]
MINMDLKGRTWVGHVYQKFEAMCLEVEEVMCQDTVKYVEDQVQTVGASVKKFYSDVMQDMMQDLLLPSSLEPLKAVAASDIPVETYAGTLKKPIVGLEEAAIKGEGEQLTEDSEIKADVNKNATYVPSSCQLQLVDNTVESCSGRFVERASHDLLAEEHNNSKVGNSKVDDLPLAATFSEAACLENEFSKISSFSRNANHEVSCQQIPSTLARVSDEENDCDSIEERCNEIESAIESIPEILNDDLQLAKSIGKKEMEMRCASSVIGSAESNVESDNNCTMDIPGSKSTMECRKEMETVPPLDKTLDESCIMVNGAKLYFNHQREGKHKPYQKRIRDAISSRMRPARTKEYKQLALWYGDAIKSDQDSEWSSMSDLTKEDVRSLNDVLDSEWELL